MLDSVGFEVVPGAGIEVGLVDDALRSLQRLEDQRGEEVAVGGRVVGVLLPEFIHGLQTLRKARFAYP